MQTHNSDEERLGLSSLENSAIYMRGKAKTSNDRESSFFSTQEYDTKISQGDFAGKSQEASAGDNRPIYDMGRRNEQKVGVDAFTGKSKNFQSTNETYINRESSIGFGTDHRENEKNDVGTSTNKESFLDDMGGADNDLETSENKAQSIETLFEENFTYLIKDLFNPNNTDSDYSNVVLKEAFSYYEISRETNQGLLSLEYMLNINNFVNNVSTEITKEITERQSSDGKYIEITSIEMPME